VAFAYDETLADDVSKVRFHIADTRSEAPLFSDEEITAALGERAGEVKATAADLCEQLATRFAREYDIGADGQSLKRSQKSIAYEKRAASLRATAGSGGLEAVQVTRVDGASDDVSGRQGARSGQGYQEYDEDEPLF